MQLPIDALLPEIVQCIEVNTITILQAEPGAGKTTRVPPGVLKSTQRPVYVLEPRKMAARLAARRVADELATPLGKVVGYQVRFEKVGDRGTQIWFLTEGVLTNRLLSREKLPDNSVVVFDEFHERHLETDVALALLRRVSASRSDLRIVIMSATLDANKLSSQLSNAPVIRAPGRVFPVTVQYLPPSSAPLEEQVLSACSKAALQTSGHILIFLPGSAEIRKAIRSCETLGRTLPARLLPLHGDLPLEEQDLALRTSAERKIIFSTNIAESSVTIDGIGAVVDSGLVRILSHSPWSGFSTLQVEKVSRSSAVQRAGRAGRTGPGIAIRLYGESDFVRRPESIAPEILRADLSQLLLQLAASNLSFAQLPWVDAPPPLAVEAAINLLSLLRAVDETGAITDLGKRMALFPVHPRLSRLLIEAVRFGARSEACRLAARLSEGRLRSVANGAHQSGGTDLDSVLSARLSHTGQRAADQFRDLTRDIRTEVPIPDPNGLEKAILAAYGDRVARRRGQELLLCGGGSAELEQGTVITSEFVVALEIEDRSDRSTPLVRLAVPIEPDWLLDTFPERIEVREEMIWNRKAERVEQVNSLRYQQLTVDETRSAPNDLRAASVLLAQTAGEVGWAKFLEDEEVRRLLQRVKFLSSHVTEIPGESELVMSALRKLSDGLTSFAELRQAAADGGLLAALHSQLDIRLLNDLAPAHINLPRGRRARIDYSEGQPPSVSSRLQDFFGMTQTPTVAGGSVPLVLKLLAPNHRPVQVTTDLVSFWKNLYPQLRRELSRRYPRHSWPESPE